MHIISWSVRRNSNKSSYRRITLLGIVWYINCLCRQSGIYISTKRLKLWFKNHIFFWDIQSIERIYSKLSGLCKAKIILGLASDLTADFECSLWDFSFALLCICDSLYVCHGSALLSRHPSQKPDSNLWPSHHRGSRCPPDKSWLCDLQPPWSHWGSADHSGWTPRCCGSAWGWGEDEKSTRFADRHQFGFALSTIAEPFPEQTLPELNVKPRVCCLDR